MSHLAPVLMLQGTASDVGKSLLVTALCRAFAREGRRVAPFKAQNMSLNAYVTPGGEEIGSAQGYQAEAAGVVPSAQMNPLLIKPMPGAAAQLIVGGRAAGPYDYRRVRSARGEHASLVAASLLALRQQHDLVIAEGAGSCAEINLREWDLANMHVAELSDAAVLLVGDIDKGGVYASLLGTLALLSDADRRHVRGFLINKFRGDPAGLAPANTELETRSGLPLLGVVPFLRAHGLPEEDGASLEAAGRAPRGGVDDVEIAVVRTPALSNFDELRALADEPGVVLRYIDNARDAHGADLVVLAGSRATKADLAWLRERGFEHALRARAQRGELTLGICGGCQMLAERIDDPDGVEGPAGSEPGLGLLPIVVRFEREKRTARVTGRGTHPLLGQAPLEGYFIHHGRAEPARRGVTPLLTLDGGERDGAAQGAVLGTMVHGLFEAPAARSSAVAWLRQQRRGGARSSLREGATEAGSRTITAAAPAPPVTAREARVAAYDALADHVCGALDMARLRAMVPLS
ncbi:MAG: cobyric acid synthase [Myxococcales bacterium]|nr:cobyric acid synthase [Myxococcales bacterium]